MTVNFSNVLEQQSGHISRSYFSTIQTLIELLHHTTLSSLLSGYYCCSVIEIFDIAVQSSYAPLCLIAGIVAMVNRCLLDLIRVTSSYLDVNVAQAVPLSFS